MYLEIWKKLLGKLFWVKVFFGGEGVIFQHYGDIVDNAISVVILKFYSLEANDNYLTIY